MTAAQLIATLRREAAAQAFRFCFERDDHWTMARLPPRPDDPTPAA